LTTHPSARKFTITANEFPAGWFVVPENSKLKPKALLGSSETEARCLTRKNWEPNMPDDWNTYRTRFLVRAKQLTESLKFTDPLGREHSGGPGDYLVQSSEGLLRIAPREIFEDVYVPLTSNRDVIPNRPRKEGGGPALSAAEGGPYVGIGPAMQSHGHPRISGHERLLTAES
jgi:hypothetical protein